MKWIAGVVVVLAVLLGIAAGYGLGQRAGFEQGKQAGKDSVTATSSTNVVNQLNTVLQGTNDLVARSNAASSKLSRLLAEAGRINSQSTEELRNALKKTAGDRIGCRYDDDVMRRLEASRSRAATAATAGTAAGVARGNGGAVSGAGGAE